MLLLNDENLINRAYFVLHFEIMNYQKGRKKRWVCMCTGLLAGIFLASLNNYLLPFAILSKYKINSLRDYCQSLFGSKGFDEVGINELLISSFEFNDNNPRLFSKYFERIDAENYKISLYEAVTSCQAFPGVFDPNRFTSQFDVSSYLIDGSMISNNPSFYAYTHAKYLLNKNDINVLALGYSMLAQDPKISRTNLNQNLFAVMRFQSHNANNILQSALSPSEYLRVNTDKPLNFDIDSNNIEDMQQ